MDRFDQEVRFAGPPERLVSLTQADIWPTSALCHYETFRMHVAPRALSLTAHRGESLKALSGMRSPGLPCRLGTLAQSDLTRA
jgi:hypothetical protein